MSDAAAASEGAYLAVAAADARYKSLFRVALELGRWLEWGRGEDGRLKFPKSCMLDFDGEADGGWFELDVVPDATEDASVSLRRCVGL